MTHRSLSCLFVALLAMIVMACSFSIGRSQCNLRCDDTIVCFKTDKGCYKYLGKPTCGSVGDRIYTTSTNTNDYRCETFGMTVEYTQLATCEVCEPICEDLPSIVKNNCSTCTAIMQFARVRPCKKLNSDTPPGP